MTITEIAAWVGALSGLGSLGWNIYLKLTAGPKLELSASPHMHLVPSLPGDVAFGITVRNNGTAPTTLTCVSFEEHNPRWNRLKKKWIGIAYYSHVIKHDKVQGRPLPFCLKVGGEWTGSILKGPDFVELLKTRTLWCVVDHSFSKNPAQVKIKCLRV